MENSHTIPIMLNYKNYNITVSSDFIICLSVELHNDFKNKNITIKELLDAYILKVHELHKMENKINEIFDFFEEETY